jgi:hypothetical protein
LLVELILTAGFVDLRRFLTLQKLIIVVVFGSCE